MNARKFTLVIIDIRNGTTVGLNYRVAPFTVDVLVSLAVSLIFEDKFITLNQSLQLTTAIIKKNISRLLWRLHSF